MKKQILTLTTAAILLLTSCAKEELSSGKDRQVTSVDVTCEKGNNWCINGYQYFLPIQEKTSLYFEESLNKFYWEDRYGNFLEIGVADLPKINETISYPGYEVAMIKARILDDYYFADNQKRNIGDYKLRITRNADGYIVSLEEIKLIDDAHKFYVDFRVCNLSNKTLK
jgi:hypothetical protein